MKNRERTTLRIVVIILGVLIVAACATGKKSVTEEDLGIRKASLYTEEGVEPAHGIYPTLSPGESKRFARAFENSPPLIPHDLTGMLPISETNNMCMGCHMPPQAGMSGAVPIPRSHLVDMDTGKDLGGDLDGKRFNCMQCHVPQVTMPAPVRNLFEGEFRDEKARYNSNLIEILNEGVK